MGATNSLIDIHLLPFTSFHISWFFEVHFPKNVMKGGKYEVKVDLRDSGKILRKVYKN